MSDLNAQFETLAEELIKQHEHITFGKMMSSPAITYKGKVFAFYHNEGMVFRLGREFDIQAHDIQNYTHLSPFKTKPPMRDWFCISADHADKWSQLAQEALMVMQAKVG